MSNYAIGIGGTGAKCMEALVHLCAAGLLPSAKNGGLYTIFVDPDKSNGNLERAQRSFKHYINVKKINFGDSPLFETNIEIATPDVWSPFEGTQTPLLEDFFLKPTLGQGYQSLFDVLYTKQEQQTSLEKGFRGHPSIGAAVMAHSVRFREREPWTTFKTKLEQDLGGGDARIFLFGSSFGGTGAAGFPTLTQLIRKVLEGLGIGGPSVNVKIGGALMLPYFSFSSNDTDNELKARAEEFLVNSQAALKYYCQHTGALSQHPLNFNSLYLLGSQKLQSYATIGNPPLGGSPQKNIPHYVEIYAALAALDFYLKPFQEFHQNQEERIVNLIARSVGHLSWSDLPNTPALKHQLGQMTKFAFAYLCEFYPVLERIKRSGTGKYESWYVDYFERKLGKKTLAEVWSKLTDLKIFSEDFLTWISALHVEDVNLIEVSSFSDQNPDAPKLLPIERFNKSRFAHLVVPAAQNDNKGGLFDIITALSKNEHHESRACEVGNFASALFSACSV